MLAFRCTVRFLPEAALLKLCSRVNLPDPAPSCCFETVTWVRPVSIHRNYSIIIGYIYLRAQEQRKALETALESQQEVQVLENQSFGDFPKLGVPFLGVPIIRTIVCWGLYWGPTILGNRHPLNWDNGKENGNYYITTWYILGYIGSIGGLYWGYIGVMEKKVETTVI